MKLFKTFLEQLIQPKSAKINENDDHKALEFFTKQVPTKVISSDNLDSAQFRSVQTPYGSGDSSETSETESVKKSKTSDNLTNSVRQLRKQIKALQKEKRTHITPELLPQAVAERSHEIEMRWHESQVQERNFQKQLENPNVEEHNLEQIPVIQFSDLPPSEQDRHHKLATHLINTVNYHKDLTKRSVEILDDTVHQMLGHYHNLRQIDPNSLSPHEIRIDDHKLIDTMRFMGLLGKRS